MANHREEWTKAVTQLQMKPTRSKYGAKRVTVDGFNFDSKREAARYRELDLRQRAGDIRRLRLQPHYTLFVPVLHQLALRDVNAVAATTERRAVCEYVADFEYEESDRGYGGVSWALVIEDAKGVRTDIYKLKRRMFESQYDIQIKEI